MKWLEKHPLKHQKEAYLFVNTGNSNKCKQLKPSNINKMIKQACRHLNISKPITCYSLKRNGVTIRRLRGDSDVEIQHVARWTSTKQLQTYDLSNQDEVFKLALQKRGLIDSNKEIHATTETKECPYCNNTIGFTESICPNCKHSLNRNSITSEVNKDDEIVRLRNQLASMKFNMDDMKREIMEDLTNKILTAKSS